MYSFIRSVGTKVQISSLRRVESIHITKHYIPLHHTTLGIFLLLYFVKLEFSNIPNSIYPYSIHHSTIVPLPNPIPTTSFY